MFLRRPVCFYAGFFVFTQALALALGIALALAFALPLALENCLKADDCLKIRKSDTVTRFCVALDAQTRGSPGGVPPSSSRRQRDL